jgi:hypothetical protein
MRIWIYISKPAGNYVFVRCIFDNEAKNIDKICKYASEFETQKKLTKYTKKVPKMPKYLYSKYAHTNNDANIIKFLKMGRNTLKL